MAAVTNLQMRIQEYWIQIAVRADLLSEKHWLTICPCKFTSKIVVGAVGAGRLSEIMRHAGPMSNVGDGCVLACFSDGFDDVGEGWLCVSDYLKDSATVTRTNCETIMSEGGRWGMDGRALGLAA